MFSVFQIFKMLLGIIVFVFIVTIFLQMSNSYTDLKQTGRQYSVAENFVYAVTQSYISGNPSEFEGFDDPETIFYDYVPEKGVSYIRFDAGQQIVAVPTFAILEKHYKILTERICDDYSWFTFCWVYAYPNEGRILFNPVTNTQDARDLMKDAIGKLPNNVGYGLCRNTQTMDLTKEDMLDYIDTTMPSQSYALCTIEIPDRDRLVIIGGPMSAPEKNTINVNPSTKTITDTFPVSGNQESQVGTVTYRSPSEVSVAITSGKEAVELWRNEFKDELLVATKVAYERFDLVRLKTPSYNLQPCSQCATPYPTDCGWTDYEDHEVFSTLYENMKNSLLGLRSAITGGQAFEQALGDTVSDYEALKNAGCE